MKANKYFLYFLFFLFFCARQGLGQAPSFTSTPVTSINAGDTYIYNIVTDDPNGDHVTITAPIKPDWLGLIVNNSNVSTLAGRGKGWGSTDANSTNASFHSPKGVAVDASGNVYVADTDNHKIRKIAPNGDVTTLAGTGSVGNTDANGVSASFSEPSGVAIDASGNIYVADLGNHKIRKIAPNGDVSTLAGSGIQGSADANGVSASFNEPSGVDLDGSGNVYIADYGNNKIRKIASNGDVTTLAGSGAYGSTDANGIDASFGGPREVTVDASENVYVADFQSGRIRKVASNGDVTTLAGPGGIGSVDGNGSSASFLQPSGVAVDASGNVYVADHGAHKIRKIAPNADVTTFAGSELIGSADGNGSSATFYAPYGLAVDASGNVFVADVRNHNIRKITPAGDVTTLAGLIDIGSVDASGSNASFNEPRGIDVDASGNVYVADHQNNKIRKITPNGDVTTFAGSGFFGSTDANGVNASFGNPSGIAVDASGNVFVADQNNFKIRKIAPNGDVTTLAGSGSQGSVDGIGSSASFISTWGIAVDPSGNVYVGDQFGHKIRKIAPNGDVTTLAGSGIIGSEDGNGSNASFDRPRGVTVDASGNVYVADSWNNKIRKITPNGDVTTLAGSGTIGNNDGNGSSASFYYPRGIVVDDIGNVYVADPGNHKIRKITPNGDVTTFAGTGLEGSDDTNVGSASFNYPSAIAFNASGVMYVADAWNNKIRKISVGSVELTGDATGHVGSHEVVIEANDGNGGITQQSFTIEVSDSPLITSSAASAVTPLSASLNGTVSSDENSTIIERGFVYSVTSIDASPTLAESLGADITKVVVAGTTGDFSEILESLTASTEYSFAAYATNSVGTTEGSILSFTTPNLSTPEIAFSDIDQIYGDGEITLEATSNSAGIITYSIIGEANGTSLSGTNNDDVSLGNVGAVLIRATQAADGIYSSNTKDINLIINPKAINVTADAGLTKVFATVDPTFTYSVTTEALEEGDSFTGSLTRAEGEDAGNYAITLGTLSAGVNYDMTFVEADFTIMTKAITITADAGQTKVYGAIDPILTYTISTGGLESDDSFTGSLSRVEGEDAGSYAIVVGTLSAGANYELTFNGADFIITAIVTSIPHSAIVPVSIYPNPTSGELHIETDNDNIGSIRVFDYSGKLLIEKTVLGQFSRVDLISHKAGFYIISIQTEKQLIKRKIRKN